MIFYIYTYYIHIYIYTYIYINTRITQAEGLECIDMSV